MSGRLATWGTLSEQARRRHQSEAAHRVALDVPHHLRHIVGHQQQTQVSRIDGSRRGQLRQELLERTPVRRADKNNRELAILPVWMSVSASINSSSVPKPPGSATKAYEYLKSRTFRTKK